MHRTQRHPTLSKSVSQENGSNHSRLSAIKGRLGRTAFVHRGVGGDQRSVDGFMGVWTA
jgi:hypothetical protein